MTALKCLIISLFNYLSLYLYINISDKYDGMLADSYSILQRWKNNFYLVLTIRLFGRLITIS
jgi:hypothetical protein